MGVFKCATSCDPRLRERLQKCTDNLSLLWLSLLILTFYTISSFLCFTAIFTTATFAATTVFLSSSIHCGGVVAAFVTIRGYKHYSVTPLGLFVAVDFVEGCALGVVLGSLIFNTSSTNRESAVFFSAVLLVLTNSALAYKSYIIWNRLRRAAQTDDLAYDQVK